MKNKFFRTVGRFFVRHADKFLMGGAILGVGTTAVLAAKGAKKTGGSSDFGDYVEAYWPAALSGVLTSGCIVGLDLVGEKAASAAIAAYAGVASAYAKYRETNEKLHPGADEDVLHEVGNTLPEAEEGLCWFFEPETGVYFQETMSAVQEARYELNRIFAGRGEALFDEWLFLLGIGPQVDPFRMNPEDSPFGWDMEYLYDATKTCWLDIFVEERVNEHGKFYEFVYPAPAISPFEGSTT